jgi:GNAT superfamily N-acetyltransferase
LYAPLETARYPVLADGRRWFLFCPWVARELRGRGLGARLFAALEAAARSAGVDGLLTFATTDERFLHEGGLAHHGFVEVARRGELRLMERTLTDVPSRARLVELPAPPPRPGALPVLVRHGYNCPLLLRTRRDLGATARAAGERVALDEADAGPDPSGATVGGRPVPHAYLPAGNLAAALSDALDHR